MPLNKPKREEVVKRHAHFSDQLSTQCRTLSAGILALSWGLMSAKESPFRSNGVLGFSGKCNLMGIAALVIVVLVLDAVQYVASLKVEEKCLKKMEADDKDSATYDKDSAYRLQESAFNAKLIGLAIAVLWLVMLLGFWAGLT